MVATESAERAISGLRSTLAECDRTLAERLRIGDAGDEEDRDQEVGQDADDQAHDAASLRFVGDGTQGRIGRLDDSIAVQVTRPLRRSRTTFAAFEASKAAKVVRERRRGRVTCTAIESSSRPIRPCVVSLIVSILADLLVAVLLVACIATSVGLGRRITRSGASPPRRP
jgi:hypothetical protein